MQLQAAEEAEIKDKAKILFIDDNLTNVQAAKRLGWGSCIWYREDCGIDNDFDPIKDVDAVVSDLAELRQVWSWLFVKVDINRIDEDP